jgi:hypothetical protein
VVIWCVIEFDQDAICCKWDWAMAFKSWCDLCIYVFNGLVNRFSAIKLLGQLAIGIAKFFRFMCASGCTRWNPSSVD